MPIPLGTVGKQLESAAKNQARAAQASVLKQSSIVRQANIRMGAELGEKNINKKLASAAKMRDGVYVQNRAVITAPDGYVRRSPVQLLRVSEDYKKKLIRRFVGAVLGVLAAGGVLALLIKYVFQA